MARKPKPQKKGAPAWMTSFADLQQLLLVFFILLFSMSTTEEAKFNAFMESMQKALKNDGLGLTNEGTSTLSNTSEFNGGAKDLLEEIASQKELQLESELKEVQRFLEENNFNGTVLTELVAASKSNEGFVLTIKDLVLFESGSAEIKDEAKNLLEKLSPLIKKKGSDIRVEGHTDNVALKENSIYKDNWELSTARASQVVGFILEQNMVKADKVSVSGYAEHKPVTENDSDENKAKNRRVDIILLSDFSEAENKAKDKVNNTEDNSIKNKDASEK